MNDESYMIKKSHREKTGKDVHVFMTDGHSQVLDSKDAVYMKNLVEILILWLATSVIYSQGVPQKFLRNHAMFIM